MVKVLLISHPSDDMPLYQKKKGKEKTKPVLEKYKLKVQENQGYFKGRKNKNENKESPNAYTKIMYTNNYGYRQIKAQTATR